MLISVKIDVDKAKEQFDTGLGVVVTGLQSSWWWIDNSICGKHRIKKVFYQQRQRGRG